MKRILFFNDGLVMGGTEILLVNLLNYLAGRDYHVSLLLPEPSVENILLTRLNPSIEIKYLYPRDSPYWVKKAGENLMIFFPRIFAFIKGIEAKDYDVIACFKEGFYALIFSHMPIRRILWIHNLLYRPNYEVGSFRERLSVWLNKKQLAVTRASYKNYNTVVGVSRACSKAYTDVLYNNESAPTNLEIIYNAVNLKEVVNKALESPVNMDTDRINFVLVTRSSPEKRIDRLIKAVSRLKEENYLFRVYVIGDVCAEQILHNKEHDLLGNFVVFTGRLGNPYPYVLQADWSLCISERESFSLTLLESMALKTPVITTNCGGPCDIVDNGKYGLLVENSSEGVYRGMKMVMDNKALYKQYTGKLETAVKRFDYSNWL